MQVSEPSRVLLVHEIGMPPRCAAGPSEQRRALHGLEVRPHDVHAGQVRHVGDLGVDLDLSKVLAQVELLL